MALRRWVSQSLLGHVVLFELIVSLPWLVWFFASNYAEGTLTVSSTLQFIAEAVVAGAHRIHRLRLRLSPLWLCSMSGRAPRPCSLRPLVVSALAQETECLRWSPWARLPFAAVGFGLRRRSRARTVALFEANSNFAWSARVNGGVASSGAGARGAHADR